MSSQPRRLEVLVLDDGRDETPVNDYSGAIGATMIAAGVAVTAQLHGFDSNNCPLISGVTGQSGDVFVARTTIPLRSEQIGSTVVLLFEQGDVYRPIIIGSLIDAAKPDPTLTTGPRTELENDRLVISADREIVLRCGDATITLTRAGKVLINGTYVSTRSLGVNRIKGGSVQIN